MHTLRAVLPVANVIHAPLSSGFCSCGRIFFLHVQIQRLKRLAVVDGIGEGKQKAASKIQRPKRLAMVDSSVLILDHKTSVSSSSKPVMELHPSILPPIYWILLLHVGFGLFGVRFHTPTAGWALLSNNIHQGLTDELFYNNDNTGGSPDSVMHELLTVTRLSLCLLH
jgi:hypothetical protein